MSQKAYQGRRKALIALALSFALPGAGCGSDEELSYEFSYNECSTGKHSFDSKEDYCNGLKSRSLNNGCAVSLRKQAYEQNCTGSFAES